MFGIERGENCMGTFATPSHRQKFYIRKPEKDYKPEIKTWDIEVKAGKFWYALHFDKIKMSSCLARAQQYKGRRPIFGNSNLK